MTKKIIKPVSAGQQFNRLTAIGCVGRDRRGVSQWKWQCQCGGQTTLEPSRVTSGHTKSCGCLFREAISTHNRSHTPEYKAWRGMRTRCQNRNVKEFRLYGARGITVCEEWDKSFEAFFRDMGPRPKDYSLDRIDNNGNYEPSNCRWASRRQQLLNKRDNRRVTFEGRTLTISEWVDISGLKRITLVNRLSRGWSIREALTTPARRSGYRLRR